MKRAAPRAGSAADALLMARALREAHKGNPSPNPHVGAVVVRGREVVGVGHHERCGGPHAEIVAMERAGARTRGATLYVSMEPCNHYGRTGPCSEAIIAAGIRRVVVGCSDPTPHVAGGRAKLRRAGVEVTFGVQRREAELLVADFRKFVLDGLPHVTLKAALTLDGRLATRSGDSKWISSKQALREAHRLRAHSDAVLVGISTVLADDPELTVRHVRGNNPLRVVLDTQLRMPVRSKLARVSANRRTLVFHGSRASQRRRQELERCGVELVSVKLDATGRPSLPIVLRELARRNVVRLLVEGGSEVHGAFLDGRLADRAVLVLAPRILGDSHATPFARGRARTRIADAVGLSKMSVRRLGPDLLVDGSLVYPDHRE